MQKQWLFYGLAAAMAVAIGCGADSKSPVSPSGTSNATVDAAAGAGGETLKVTAPTLQSPAEGVLLENMTPDLVIVDATGIYQQPSSPMTYRFQVSTTSGGVIEEAVETAGAGSAGANRTVHSVSASTDLGVDTIYRWRARAELGANFGPWSSYFTFRTPVSPGSLPGFISATELWDPLTDGKTVGTAVNATFVPDRGILLPTFESHVTYTLQNTLTSGNIQFLIEELDSDTNGGKTKIVSMQQGYTDITDNPYRFNVEKRGDDHVDVGKFRMRIITGDPDDGFYDSARLLPQSLVGSKTYHVSVTWGGGEVRLVVREGSEKGPAVVDGGHNYEGTYRPNPHVVHIGAPVPRGGPLDATVPGIIVRYFHVSQGAQWPGQSLLGKYGLLQQPGSGR